MRTRRLLFPFVLAISACSLYAGVNHTPLDLGPDAGNHWLPDAAVFDHDSGPGSGCHNNDGGFDPPPDAGEYLPDGFTYYPDAALVPPDAH